MMSTKTMLVIATFVIVAPTTILADISERQILNKARNKVEDIYKELKVISDRNADPVKVSRIVSEFEDNFAANEVHCPNEFKSIWRENAGVAGYKDIRPDRYAFWFRDMFRSVDYLNCSFEYQTMLEHIVSDPRFDKKEAPAKYATVVMRKSYCRKNIPFAAFNDTLLVNVEKMQVIKWANSTSTHPIGYLGGEVLDLEQQMANAALAYSRKRYDEAYRIYRGIVDRQPKEGDPYYRMAVMLYKREYGRNMTKRDRNRLVLEYLDKAMQYGSYAVRGYANNMKYWLTC